MLNQTLVDRQFRALAEPTRRAIVERLSCGPASVSALARPFQMSLAAVVQHLQVLEASGLIRSTKVGRIRTCRIEVNGMRTLSEWITKRRTLVERQLDRLGTILAESDPNTTSIDNKKGA